MNPVRGEVTMHLDGQPRSLCLTLGALAEIMGAVKASSIPELMASLRQLDHPLALRAVIALLRGSGHPDLAAELADSPNPWARVSPEAAAHAVAGAFEAAFHHDG